MSRRIWEWSKLAVVQTVAGPVDTADLGRTLMHEHIFVVSPEVSRDYPRLGWGDKGARILDARQKIEAARAGGIDTIVDLTTLGAGRCIPEVKELQEQVSVNIIVATGYYTFDELPAFAANRRVRDPGKLIGGTGERILEQLFVEDITEGIPGTGVRAAIIKCATHEQGLTPDVETVLRAAARAHRATGVPISTHTAPERHTGRDQQRVFAEEGVNLSRVVIGHCGESGDLGYLHELLDRGSFIGFDRFGFYAKNMPSLEQRADMLAALCAEGHAGQIVLSHDAMCHCDRMDRTFWEKMPEWVYSHLTAKVLPALVARGVTQGQIDQMLIDNPRRIFEAGAAY